MFNISDLFEVLELSSSLIEIRDTYMSVLNKNRVSFH